MTLASEPHDLSGLPVEIVVLIFHEACRTSFACTLALSQTATWPRRLALAYLYLTLIIMKPRWAWSMSKTLPQPAVALADPPFIPAPHVRQLWIGLVKREATQVFQLCDNVSHLAVEDSYTCSFLIGLYSKPGDPDFEATRAAIAAKPDMELFVFDALEPWSSSELFHTHPERKLSPIFLKIRRLWIGKMHDYGDLDMAHFPRLTHIAIPYHIPSAQKLARLLQFPSIKCIVFVLSSDMLTEEQHEEALQWVAKTREVHRKVLVVSMRHESMRTHWEESVLPGGSIWDKAAIFTDSLDTATM